MRVLVTGGAGFIGSHIAEALCQKGAKVTVLDNLRSGSLENLKWKRANDSVDFVQGDVSNITLLKKLVPGCDWVFHQAAIPSVPVSIEQPAETNEQNLDATLQLLILARDSHVKRFLFASSSAIYGNSIAPAKSENDLIQPLSPYGLQKYASERYCQMFYWLYGFETVALRYFNVFGPRQAFDSPYSGVIARFCTIALAGGRPTIFGDGNQSRDFTAIANVVDANILAAEAPAAVAAGKVFNVGTGISVTLLQLLTELANLTGHDLDPEFKPERVGDIKSSRADISAAKTAIGYAPRVSWQAGLRETLDYYRR